MQSSDLYEKNRTPELQVPSLLISALMGLIMQCGGNALHESIDLENPAISWSGWN